jgi:hypothetical protein
MPPFARLLALSITVALAALGVAPAAQAAVLPLTHVAVAVVDSPHDGVVAGGDTLLITETLHNSDPVTLTGLTATLATQTAGVTIDQGSSAYPDVVAGADAANATPLQVTLDPSLPCGTTLHFSLTVTNGTGSAVVPFTVATGAQGDFTDYTGTPAVIGETVASLRKVLSSVSYAGIAHVSDPGIVEEVRVTIGSLNHLDISHLSLALKAPNPGPIVPLVNAGHGGAGQSFTNTELVPAGIPLPFPGAGPFTGRFKADGDLSAMAGLSQQGDWQLVVTEPNDNEMGRVNSWTLHIAAASCAPRSAAKLTATPNPVDPGASVLLDASGSVSADPGGITRYEWDLDDGTGFHVGASPTTASRTEIFPLRGARTVRVRVSDATGVIGTASVNLIVSHLPNAVIGLPSGVKEQTYATLDGSGSNDNLDNGAISSYEWETDGDDDFNDYTGSQPSVYFATPGSHTIKLRVTDGDGAQHTTTTTLNVIATTPPSPTFLATPNPVVAGQPVSFDASGSTDDGTIVRYEWDLDGNGSYETDGGASPMVTRSFPNATVMSIGVRATDDDGRTAVARSPLVVNAPAGAGGGTGGGSPGFDPGAPDGSGDSGGSGGSGGSAGSKGGSSGSGGGSSGAGAGAATLDAGLDGASIQTLKLVSRKGLGLRCSADRAATCTVSASLQAADARRLGLSKSKTKPYLLGKATVKLKKAGAAVVTVRLARRALSRLKRAPRVTVLVTGRAVDGGGGQVALRRAILIRR